MKNTLKLVLVCIISCWALASNAQYGFEWIRAYQPYYKIKIVQTGVYTLDSAFLVSNGINLNGLHPNRFQVFKNGVEQTIYVAGQNDGVFNQTDFIEFLGERNNGQLDSQLYANTADQPHVLNSLFSDTSVYFLTILPDTANSFGKRFTTGLSSTYNSFTAESYFLYDATVAPVNEYVQGINLNPGGDQYNSSDYTDGEGWADTRLSIGGSKVYSLPTPNLAAVALQPTISLKVVGVSDYVFGNPPNNHHVRMSIAKAELPTYTTVTDLLFKGYISKQYSGTVGSGSIGAAQTLVKMDVVNDLAITTDYSCLSYIKITYPRLYNLNGTTNIGLNVLHTQGGIRSRLSWVNYGGTRPVLYDLTSGQRVYGTMNGGTAELLVNNSGKPHQVYVFDSTSTIAVTQMQAVSFKVIAPENNYTFLIVTHPSLEAASSAYEGYRAQQYQTLRVYSEQLYDYYTYGQFHPLAIKRFSAHLLNTATQKPKFLLLLGKGYQGNVLKGPQNYADNLVPAIGVPASDVMFSSGIVGTGFTNDIATGRIPASTNDEAQHYLDKLIEYEIKPDSILLWRKNILHISGGENLGQQTVFKFQMAQNAQTIKGKNLGADVIAYNKDISTSVSLEDKAQLIKTINNGVNMLTFLGHGSSSILDVDFGGINDMNNEGKYTFFYFNGCNIGNPSDEDPTTLPDLYGKGFICAEKKGAIGWLAHSNITLDGKLYVQMNSFYNQYALQNYGSSIGTIVKASGEAIAGADMQLRSHALQLTLMGDPAMKIYSPYKPDYAVENSGLFMNPANATAQLDSVSMGIICTNLGKAQDDTVEVSLTHIRPDNTRKTYYSRFPAPIYFRDTVEIKIALPKNNAVGNNGFEVVLDEQLKLDELSRMNNTANFNFYIPGNGIKSLLPSESSIVTSDTVDLMVQNNDLRISSVEYLFELDTTPLFNSPLLQQSGILQQSALGKWKVVLTAPNHTVYFWRAKMNLDESKGGIWDTSSFTLVRNGKKGWQQTHWAQYNQSVKTVELEVNSTQSNQLEFADNGLEVMVRTARWYHSNTGVFDPYYNNPKAQNCVLSGIVCVKYDGISLAKGDVEGYPRNCSTDPGYSYYAFDTKTIAGQNAFVSMIDSVRDGDFIALYSLYDAGISSWTAGIRNALSKIGSVAIANATDPNTCFVLVGKKGETPGSAEEEIRISDVTDTAMVITRRMVMGKWFTGGLITDRIGPVSSWDSIQCNFTSIENNGGDRVYLTVLAQNKQGVDTVVVAETTQLNHSIASLNALQYPYLRLQVRFVDSLNRTPNQFGRWKVTYQPSPEGTINTQREFLFYKTVVDQGDSIQIRFAFENISDQDFDSLPVVYTITDANRQLKYTASETKPKLVSGDYTVIDHKISTVQLGGANTLSVAVNGSNQVPELDLVNNFITQGFDVNADLSSPVLDVTFDGYRIMNGDFVSPTPVIRLQSKDDNQFKLQTDTSTFVLFLKRPGVIDYERVSLGSSQIVFKAGSASNNTAAIEYKPERFEDGKYTLKVQSQDASGNAAGYNSYEIEFAVVNESTITNFYPYPNPGTTNIRFVFTLTGSKAPDQLLIRIMTITGKVVKEVTQNEFGPIKIGNNISEFAWDGTDNFGDRLANGVYLYQVFTKLDGQAIKKRDTAADQYVLHNTGKIYLLK